MIYNAYLLPILDLGKARLSMARIHDIISCMQGGGEGEGSNSRPGNRGGELSRKVDLSVWSLRSTNLVDYSINPFIPIALKYLSYLSKVIGHS